MNVHQEYQDITELVTRYAQEARSAFLAAAAGIDQYARDHRDNMEFLRIGFRALMNRENARRFPGRRVQDFDEMMAEKVLAGLVKTLERDYRVPVWITDANEFVSWSADGPEGIVCLRCTEFDPRPVPTPPARRTGPVQVQDEIFDD